MILYVPLRILPRFVSNFLWEWSRGIPGFIGMGLRYVLLKRLAKSCGKNVAILPSANLFTSKNLVIGNHISIRENTFVDGDALELGDNVMISHSASVITASHVYDPNLPMRDTLEDRPVKIGNNVWIGTGAKIIGSLTIGDNVIVSANAVVTKSIPSNVVVAGVPARIIKTIS